MACEIWEFSPWSLGRRVGSQDLGGTANVPAFFLSHLCICASLHVFETRAIHSAALTPCLHFFEKIKGQPWVLGAGGLLLVLLLWCQRWKMELSCRDVGCVWSWLLHSGAHSKAGLALSVCRGEDSQQVPVELWSCSYILAQLWCKRLMHFQCCEVVIWFNLFHIELINCSLSCIFLTSSEETVMWVPRMC